MAKASPEIVEVLRKASKKLSSSKNYQWGHMGSCNCGFLAQEISSLSKAEIHSRAMLGHGDWTEQLNDYCPSSGLLMDDLIDSMLAIGFTRMDLQQLEKLSNSEILKQMPAGLRYPKHNKKEDVVAYLETWANLLADELIENIDLPKTEIILQESIT